MAILDQAIQNGVWRTIPAMRFLAVLALWVGLGVSGCGYALQNSYSGALDQAGVRRIYVAPVVNNSYKSGVENLVYNALLKSLAGNRWIVLVRSPADADAVLNSSVITAQYSGIAPVAGSSLNRSPGTGGDFSHIPIAASFASQIECSFSLMRRNPPPGKSAILWSASFSRGAPFPSANQLGALGTTSALINESEFDRTLQDSAQLIAADVRESMLSRF